MVEESDSWAKGLVGLVCLGSRGGECRKDGWGQYSL